MSPVKSDAGPGAFFAKGGNSATPIIWLSARPERPGDTERGAGDGGGRRRRLFLLANTRHIRDNEGKITGAVTAYADRDPAQRIAAPVDLRRREAEEASVRKTRFLAAVSHDIRTPANAISLLAELVRRTAANPAMAGDVAELARELHCSAVSLVNLLSDVLDIARFDSGKVELQESDFSLASLLEEEHRHLLPLAREKGIEFNFQSPPQVLWLRADRIKLARVLGNLIGNAIKFTQAGEVRLDAEHIAEGGVRDPRNRYRNRYRRGASSSRLRRVLPTAQSRARPQQGDRLGIDDLQTAGRRDGGDAQFEKRSRSGKHLYRDLAAINCHCFAGRYVKERRKLGRQRRCIGDGRALSRRSVGTPAGLALIPRVGIVVGCVISDPGQI